MSEPDRQRDEGEEERLAANRRKRRKKTGPRRALVFASRSTADSRLGLSPFCVICAFWWPFSSCSKALFVDRGLEVFSKRDVGVGGDHAVTVDLHKVSIRGGVTERARPSVRAGPLMFRRVRAVAGGAIGPPSRRPRSKRAARRQNKGTAAARRRSARNRRSTEAGI